MAKRTEREIRYHMRPIDSDPVPSDRWKEVEAARQSADAEKTKRLGDAMRAERAQEALHRRWAGLARAIRYWKRGGLF